ncbi:MAG TPA: hypothetical protein VFD92_04505 [Candidatus Binatia bacterium]|nr:hypothetical protein [Candidatus Binatia bacterium]
MNDLRDLLRRRAKCAEIQRCSAVTQSDVLGQLDRELDSVRDELILRFAIALTAGFQARPVSDRGEAADPEVFFVAAEAMVAEHERRIRAQLAVSA